MILTIKMDSEQYLDFVREQFELAFGGFQSGRCEFTPASSYQTTEGAVGKRAILILPKIPKSPMDRMHQVQWGIEARVLPHPHTVGYLTLIGLTMADQLQFIAEAKSDGILSNYKLDTQGTFPEGHCLESMTYRITCRQEITSAKSEEENIAKIVPLIAKCCAEEV